MVSARSLDRPPVVTSAILAANIAIFVVGYLLPSLSFDLAQINPAVNAGQWWRVFTGAFVHAGMLHIFFNMYALWIFGPQIERQVGGLAFAGLYLASLLWGAAAFLALAPGATAVGASGAIFGLFGAWIGASYRARHTPAGRRMFQQLVLLLGINLALPLFIPSVAWQAHVGGLAAGVAVVALWQRMPRASRNARAVAAFAVAAAAFAVVLVLTVVR